MCMDGKLSRRRIVQLSGAATLAALAGCGGNGSDETATTTTADETPTGTEVTATPTETEMTETETAGTETAGTETATEPTETETGTASDETVTPHGDVHAHGTMVVEINGETYTLADKSWNQERNTGEPHFHFHEGSGHYHVHSAGVTLDYALDSLPRVEAAPETFEFRGQTYDASADGTQIRYVADGEEVGLDRVISDSAPDLRVVVETDAATPAPVTTSS